MTEKFKIRKVTIKILAGLKQQNYSPHTINRYRQCYDSLLKYTRERRIKDYSASLGLDFIKHKFGLKIEDIYCKQPENAKLFLKSNSGSVGLPGVWQDIL